MTAFFRTLTAHAPDDDGDVRATIELSVINSTSALIHRIQHKTWMLGDEDICFCEYEDSQDIFLPPGESTILEPGLMVHQREIQESRLTFRSSGYLCRRDYAVLGELSVPGPGQSSRLQKRLSFDWCSESLSLIMSCSEYDSNGTSEMEFKSLISSSCRYLLPHVEIRAVILDSDGVEVTTVDAIDRINPESSMMIRGGFWHSPSDGHLEGATAIFALKAYVAVDHFDASETTEIAQG